MNAKQLVAMMCLLALMLTVAPMLVAAKGPGGSGGEETTATNNLSFPAIVVDAFSITPLPNPSFTVPYTGTYPGLTTAEINALAANGPWYPQKTTGNTWQADFVRKPAVDVSYIDWGDNIESVSPKIRRPFRLEVTLYKQLDEPMMAYTMAVLEYPSSSNELQGTNITTYEHNFATVISEKPKLVIQYLGASVPAMTWLGTQWDNGTVVPVSFGPELNVGGKYVYGASEGGWKPTRAGYYRITFYVPRGSGVNLASAQIGNYADFSTGTPPAGEGTVATPVIDAINNLTYVDVLVLEGNRTLSSITSFLRILFRGSYPNR